MQIAEGGREVAVHYNVFNFNFSIFWGAEICFLYTITLLQGGPKNRATMFDFSLHLFTMPEHFV